jgi:hypothetical protein
MEVSARLAEDKYGVRRMSEGGESSISHKPRPGVDTPHAHFHRSRIAVLILRLQVVRDTGTEAGGGSRVAALAASSANSLPTVPMCASVHRFVMWSPGSVAIAVRARLSYAIA